MWTEKQLERRGTWPEGSRLPIIVSVRHQAEEACVQFPDGQPDPFDFYERQYGGRRGAWRLPEIMSKHDVLGTWIICGATCEKYPEISRQVQRIAHAIAGHGYAHEMVCNLAPHEEIEVIRRTVRVFELKAQFDALYERGANRAVLMPLTVHDFITGRPARSKVFDDFLAYAKQFDGVVFATHDQVRNWWMKNYTNSGD